MELPRDRRNTAGWGCKAPSAQNQPPVERSARARPAREAGSPARRLPSCRWGSRRAAPGPGKWTGEVRAGAEPAALSSHLGLLPLPFNVTKRPGSSDEPHGETGTWRMWSAARSGQNLPRHGFHFSTTSPTCSYASCPRPRGPALACGSY